MVHGLEGTSCDMRVIWSILSYFCPDTIFVLSEENEEDTKDNIGKMGIKLAREVKSFLEYYDNSGKYQISFIGHSLGGLIIWSALPYLKKYKDQFHTLATINTPHLGSTSKKFLVNTGMKFLTRFKG